MSYQTPIDEKQLIRDLKSPENAADAFNLLMRTYGEKIYWQIRRMVISHDDAADLLQNVFLKAWSNVSNFRGDAKLSTWLHKIAVNESINFLNRNNKKGDKLSAEDSDLFLANLESDPWFDGDKLKADLLNAISKLPRKQQLVFNMRYFDEMKYEEIAEILGTSVGALKASYHHAVKKIEEEFKL